MPSRIAPVLASARRAALDAGGRRGSCAQAPAALLVSPAAQCPGVSRHLIVTEALASAMVAGSRCRARVDGKATLTPCICAGTGGSWRGR